MESSVLTLDMMELRPCVDDEADGELQHTIEH